ncbi:AAA family ATPase [Pantoea dispersa]|uniref:AAA family ATPase n=1 Tax=Pantoea dispersa TaxID=59814 RepID=UPI0021B077F8|nr:AAA family ATPase [Pantoea dispersa]MCT6588559.1 AAA family ATPase [Pantoea dispersa]
MEIVHIYIEEHKSIRNLNIPINGNFECFHHGDHLTLGIHDNNLSAYYNNITISAIIGKNGTGKTSILNFLESLVKATDSSGMIIFYLPADKTFHLCYINSSKLSDNNITIKAEKFKYKHIFKCKDFVADNKIELVEINNLSSESLGLTLSRNNPNSSFLNLSLKNNLSSEKIKRDYFSKLFNYFNDVFFMETFHDNIFFELKINPSPLRIMRRAINSDLIESENQRAVETATTCAIALHNIQLFDNGRLSNNLIGMNVLSILSQLSKLTHNDAHFQNKVLFYLIHTFAQLNHHHGDNMAYHNCLQEAVRSLEFEENWPKFNNDDWGLNFSEEDLHSLFKNIEITKLKVALSSVIKQLVKLSELIEDNDLEYKKTSSNIFKLEDYTLMTSISKLVEELPREISDNIELGWRGISTGELAYTHIFSETFHYLSSTNISDIKNSIIIIDEVDLYLHPEWQRTFLSRFIQLIDYCYSAKNSVIPQIILTTHSPIITGDFLPKDIVSIYKEEDESIVIKPSIGFGTSISDLYLNGMHLTAIFGEHSKKHINQIIKRAQEDKLTEFDKELIKQISDKHVRDYLLPS